MLNIWLPLINDLSNNGIDEVIVTENNLSIKNGGKLGEKYYSFNGMTSNLIISNTNFFINKDFSIMFWIKSPNVDHDVPIIECNMFSIIKTSSHEIAIEIGGQTYTTLDAQVLNDWTHVAVIKNKNILTVFKNGMLSGTFQIDEITDILSTNILINFDANDSNYLGTIQGLIITYTALHKKFIELASSNLLMHLMLSKSYNDNLLSLDDIDSHNMEIKKEDNILYCKNLNVSSYLYIPSSNFIINNFYTLSFKFVSLDEDFISNLYCGNTSCEVVTFIFDGIEYDNVNEIEIEDDLVHSIIITFKYIGNGQLPHFYVYPNYNNSTKGNFKFFNIKLEDGLICTPYCPNSLDPLFQELGYDDNIIYDVSGYGNNCVIHGGATPKIFADEHYDQLLDEKIDYLIDGFEATGSTEWNSDNVPRSLMCYSFNGIDQYISGNVYFGYDNCYTVSFWIYIKEKPDDECPCVSLLDEFGDGLEIGINTSNFIISSNVSNTNYELNTWYHLCLTNDKNNSKFYINGVLDATFNSISSTGGSLFIGGIPRSNSYFIGCFCDVRIFGNALLERKIRALNNSPISISDDSSLYIQGEYIEL